MPSLREVNGMDTVLHSDRTFIGESCEASLEFGGHVCHREPALLFQDSRRSIGSAVSAALVRTNRRASATPRPAGRSVNTDEVSVGW